MKKNIIAALFSLCAFTGCYLPTGMHRVTDIRFNGIPQPDDDCVRMVVQRNVLTCVRKGKNK